jgi:hypothetical protein
LARIPARRRALFRPKTKKDCCSGNPSKLNRARVLEQLKRSHNARYTEMLNQELEQLEQELGFLTK